MNEDNTRSRSVGNEDDWFELGKIGNVLISCRWENNQAILIVENYCNAGPNR